MAIKTDFHLHSSFSGDCDEPMENAILHATRIGLTHICFTEHMDMDYPVSADCPEGMFLLNTDSYLYDLIRLKEKYAAKIQVLFGVEIGLQPHLFREISVYTKGYDFDFIIGSVHVANQKDPYYPAFYEGRSDEEAYREYFGCVLENVKKFQNFDVCGHLDYCVRYGKNKDFDYSYEKYKDAIDPILYALLESEKGLELNTGSLRSGTRDVSPCTAILKRYRELGGEIITVGSDAHKSCDIASDFDRAREILSDCGFRYYTVFEKRQPEFFKL